MEPQQFLADPLIESRMTTGARVALSAPVALWPAGSMGTVTGAVDSLTSHFDYLVELDAGGSLYFRFDELRMADGLDQS